MIKTKDYHTFSMIRIKEKYIFSRINLFEKVMIPEFCHLLKIEKTHRYRCVFLICIMRLLLYTMRLSYK